TESSNTHAGHRGFGPAGYHDIGKAISNHLRCFADRVGARGACAHRCEVRTLGANINGDVSTGHIRQQHRYKEGGNAAWSAVEQVLGTSFECLDTAHTRADEYTNAFGDGTDIESSVLHCLASRDYRE